MTAFTYLSYLDYLPFIRHLPVILPWHLLYLLALPAFTRVDPLKNVSSEPFMIRFRVLSTIQQNIHVSVVRLFNMLMLKECKCVVHLRTVHVNNSEACKECIYLIYLFCVLCF